MSYLDPHNPVDRSIQELIDLGIVTIFSLGGEPIVALTKLGEEIQAGLDVPDTWNEESPLTEADEEGIQTFLEQVDKDVDMFRKLWHNS